MASLEELNEAYGLVKKFQRANEERDTEMAIGGQMPDMVDSLLGLAQAGVLAWAINEEHRTGEQKQDAAIFADVYRRLKKQYGGS